MKSAQTGILFCDGDYLTKPGNAWIMLIDSRYSQLSSIFANKNEQWKKNK
jgi:hypothetical protein